jgi:hypothetical protein
MFSSLKEYFIKKMLVKGIIAQLEKLFAKLPQDDAKTAVGVLVMCLGLVLSSLPQTAPFVQPVLDYLRTLPATEIVAGGVLWTGVGLFHKILKWVVRAAGLDTAKDKAEKLK